MGQGGEDSGVRQGGGAGGISAGDMEVFRAQLEEWVTWAREHADNMDPVRRLGMIRQDNPPETDDLPDDCETE